ncbi:hypothetical protein Cato_85 [Acinetobacter phage Cato]|nr:hypothetical protein Cato_85 [Acinetobacter phage Cato]
MTIEEIRANAPEGATHYGIEHDECGEAVVYLTANSWGFCYCPSGLSVDEYEAYLLQIKPL